MFEENEIQPFLWRKTVLKENGSSRDIMMRRLPTVCECYYWSCEIITSLFVKTQMYVPIPKHISGNLPQAEPTKTNNIILYCMTS